jgi:hypothetical protein
LAGGVPGRKLSHPNICRVYDGCRFEMTAVNAFDQPRDKWQFLFALQPGF